MTIASSHSDDALLQRIRSEFHEMPGLCLTVAQAARLWNLDVRSSEMALRMLVDRGVLSQTDDGRFVAVQWTPRADADRTSLAR